jgi:hypothetical protein
MQKSTSKELNKNKLNNVKKEGKNLRKMKNRCKMLMKYQRMQIYKIYKYHFKILLLKIITRKAALKIFK